ncbi:MAG: hypothetical protein OEY33_03750 [Bdellovibrionales bacterium]|nr:hypothetical protein [Bdellovibrionales bacterium]
MKFCEGDTVSYLGGKNKATFFDDDYVYGPAVQSASRRFRVSINKIEKVDYSPDCDKRQEILQKDAFFILCQKGHLKKDPRCRY